MENRDEEWMALALAEAAKGLGLTAPNPPVGAVVVKDGRELGRGWHHRAGQPHAERVAIAGAVQAHGADALQGATIYVTLEPCSTTGRTPPCTQSLVDHGISRVVYSSVDPNPLHTGRANAILHDAGIEVVSGILAEKSATLLQGFTSAQTRGRPWVIAKSAMALDGAITRPPGEGPWLTGPESMAEVQSWRATVDAILTSGETLRRDNPALTLRVPHPHGPKNTPWRVVVTRSGRLPADARVFTDEHANRTLVIMLGRGTLPSGLPKGIQVLRASGWLEALALLTTGYSIHRVLVEAGGRLLGSLFDSRLIDEWLGWFAPITAGTGTRGLGGLGHAPPLSSPTLAEPVHERFGDDVLIRGRVVYPDPSPRVLRPAVFFDRDGVVNDTGSHYYVTRWEDFHFCPGIRDALQAAKRNLRATILVTSQRGVGKGVMTAEALGEIHRRMQAELAKEDLAFDAIYAYTGATADGPGAKPDPLFLHEAAAELGLDLGSSWMVGDSDRDIEMGRRAGLRTIRVTGEKPIGVEADFSVCQVSEVAAILS